MQKIQSNRFLLFTSRHIIRQITINREQFNMLIHAQNVYGKNLGEYDSKFLFVSCADKLYACIEMDGGTVLLGILVGQECFPMKGILFKRGIRQRKQ
ncbi:hypothetical protein SS50377_26311 [Spironucleus salmonicida]|uniref:Uncharacterized protein n=1 Tax=Spironucleus salmonicida TaxID=348837 RepID=A0A9P8RWN6_9EUKA|nr:hypothetical protein SS50377_26311 [Spironucleus salmonicida]